jgi:hypothetical protein
MANDADQIRELRAIYLTYGAAMHSVDALEETLIEILAVFDSAGPDAKEGQRLHDAIRESSRRVIGDLLSRLRDHVTVDRDSEAFLRKALEARNALVHRFFREHATDTTTTSGRNEMTKRLLKMMYEILRGIAVLMALEDIVDECVSSSGRAAFVASLQRLQLLSDIWQRVLPGEQSSAWSGPPAKMSTLVVHAQVVGGRSRAKRKAACRRFSQKATAWPHRTVAR